MRASLLFSLILLFTLSFLQAEENKPVPETRKRSRFLIYDVKPVLIGKEETTASLKEDSAGQDATREALRGIRLPAENQFGSNLATPVTTLPMMESRSAEEPEEASEEDSWVSPLDFLATEDLIVQEEGLEAETEAPPADWESLEQTLQEQQGVEEPDSDARSVEGEDNPFEAQPTRTAVSTGLQLNSVLAEPTPGVGSRADGETLSDTTSRVRTGSITENTAALNQPLPPAMRLGADSPVPSPTERDSFRGLEGSRALFTEVRERWEPTTGSTVSERSSPVTSPLESSAVRSIGSTDRRTLSDPAPAGFRVDPAPVLRQERSFQPATPDLNPVLRTPRSADSQRQRSTQPTLDGFQRRDSGVRSRIGELPGMGRP